MNFLDTLLGKKNDSVIGIDIGSSAIKIVQIKKKKGKAVLETYGELALGPYAGIEIGRATNLPMDKIAEALTDVLREANTTTKQCGITLPLSSSLITFMTVPTTDEKQLGGMVTLEARKYIPISLSKVALDWIVLGPTEDQASTRVLVSAIYNEAMEWYEAILRAGTYTIAAREIEAFSVIRSAVSPKDETVAIIDLGASSTRLYIVTKGVVRKTHSVPLSGVAITTALAGELDIDFEKAEEKKRVLGLEGDAQDLRVQKVILSQVERGLRELHTVIKRFEESESVKIQKIILSGGGALLVGLPAYAHDMFSIPVMVAEPFAKVAYPAFLEKTLKEGGAPFAVALGAALRSYRNT